MPDQDNHKWEDHNLLIELKTRLEDLRQDIKDLKDGFSTTIADHEKRIKSLEITTSRYMITITLYSIFVAGLTTLILYHIFKV